MGSHKYHIECRVGAYYIHWLLVMFPSSNGQIDLEAYKVRVKYLDHVQFINNTGIISSCAPLESASTAVWITTSALIITSGTLIIVIAVSKIRRLRLGFMQSPLRTIYCVLNSCNVDANLEFPISGIFAHGGFNKI